MFLPQEQALDTPHYELWSRVVVELWPLATLMGRRASVDGTIAVTERLATAPASNAMS
ncbi:MAG: hypothetical protein ABI068_17440 [Ktedonobacterales bacterium]